MFIPVAIGTLAIISANYLYSLVAYSDKCKDDPYMAYGLGILAAMISIVAWIMLIRHYKDPNTIMIINCIWDVGGTITLLAIPLFLFDFKLDTKTVVGCVISVIGIIIAKI